MFRDFLDVLGAVTLVLGVAAVAGILVWAIGGDESDARGGP